MNHKNFHSLPIFVIHKHQASSLHYDLRLEEGGVLKSWAIPKGPSTNSDIKRLAIQVPDHELSYAGFEGVIEKGYGAGPVLIWDTGTFENIHPSHSLSERLEKGSTTLIFHGEKLRGKYMLIRIRLSTPHSWLFFKGDDEHARSDYSITDEEPYSVLSGKSIEELTKR
ncbi:DNA ligase [Candidatus Dependentiae bacterium]|nr:DNA ligase [Candidatus Dependentiae bacterium]